MGYLLMSEKEQVRHAVLSQVASGSCSLAAGAKRLGLSYRQALRMKQRYKSSGARGLTHRRRGQPSKRQYSDKFKASVLKRYQEIYDGFGPTFASEKLAEDGYKINRETLRGWLIQADLWDGKSRKYKARTRRARRPCFGDLLQIDGSIHRWFSDDRYTCLLNAVDDATSMTYAIMRGGETTEGALSLLKGWIARYGIPKSVYVDLKNVYVGGSRNESVFLSVCERLGIEVIKAYSPQAKGRVERSHAVYQDRLVKEIGLQGLRTIDEVNTLLANGFVDDLNRRFAKAPERSESGHAPSPSGQPLDDLFYTENTRQVQNDWTIRYQGSLYQLEHAAHIRKKTKVSVRCYLDGRLKVYSGYKEVAFSKIESRPVLKKAKTELQEKQDHKPAIDHPWRRYKTSLDTQAAVVG